jgi:hypothetical protein
MPEHTSEEAVSGFIGLTVVVARLKAIIAAMSKQTPITTNKIMTISRAVVLSSIAGTINEIHHMAAANNAAIMGGGILFSSVGIMLFVRSKSMSLNLF